MATTKTVALSYFDNAILEAHQKRAPAPKTAAPTGPTIEFMSGARWPVDFVVKALREFHKTGGYWPRTALGPPPGEVGCDVPADLIAEHIPHTDEVAA